MYMEVGHGLQVMIAAPFLSVMLALPYSSLPAHLKDALLLLLLKGFSPQSYFVVKAS